MGKTMPERETRVGSERKARAPNLDERRLSRAVEVIRTAELVPTWAGVIRALKAEFGVEYTRQALASRPCIAAAYEARRSGGIARVSAAAQRRAEAARKHADVMARMRSELEATRERMMRWGYNAFVSAGLDETVLDRPLPPKEDGGGWAGRGRRQGKRGGGAGRGG